MAKFKTRHAVVNRGGKKYVAKDWIIEVDAKDVEHFVWFEEVKPKAPKKTKDEDNKKTD